MNAIVVASPEGKGTVQINPLHLVAWTQVGKYGSIYGLSTDNEKTPLRKTPTPAEEITRQFDAILEGLAGVMGGVR